MKSKLGAVLAAITLAIASIASTAPAEARDHGRGGYNSYGYHGGYGRGPYYYGGDYRHYSHDDGDAVAAGVIGLALGAVLGAALASPPQQSYAPPPQRYYAPPPQPYYNAPPQGYYDGPQSYNQGYDEGRTCTRRERQWDRYAQRYVTVDIPYQC